MRRISLALLMTDGIVSQPKPGKDACVHKRSSPYKVEAGKSPANQFWLGLTETLEKEARMRGP